MDTIQKDTPADLAAHRLRKRLTACGYPPAGVPADTLDLFDWAGGRALKGLDTVARERLADLRAQLAHDGVLNDRVEYVITDPELGVFAGTGAWFLPVWTKQDSEPRSSVPTFTSISDAENCIFSEIPKTWSKTCRPVFNSREPGVATIDDLQNSLIPDDLIGTMNPPEDPSVQEDLGPSL